MITSSEPCNNKTGTCRNLRSRGWGGCGQLLATLIYFSQNGWRETLTLLVIDALHDLLIGRRHGLGQPFRSFSVLSKQQLKRLVCRLYVFGSEEVLRFIVDHNQRSVLMGLHMFD